MTKLDILLDQSEFEKLEKQLPPQSRYLIGNFNTLGIFLKDSNTVIMFHMKPKEENKQ